VSYDLGLYIPEEGILHSHRREILRSVCLLVTNTALGIALQLNIIFIYMFVAFSLSGYIISIVYTGDMAMKKALG
jgi:hypothetical protein